MSTPHIQAKKGEIARTVIMPGDPLRAKYIAENFLKEAKLVNEVRCMYAYTGEYNGKRVTVMASGMGMPSIGIYSYELYSFYDVEHIIRIGSAGAYVPELKMNDVVLADCVWSESSFAKTQNGCLKDEMYPSPVLNKKILSAAEKIGIEVKPVKVHSCDVFYIEANMDDYQMIHQKHGCACIDMESFALFHNAEVLEKHAACLLTISDSFVTNEKLSAEERQKSFTSMMRVALEAC